MAPHTTLTPRQLTLAIVVVATGGALGTLTLPPTAYLWTHTHVAGAYCVGVFGGGADGGNQVGA